MDDYNERQIHDSLHRQDEQESSDQSTTRLTTLLSDRVSLSDERNGSIPTLKPDDTGVKGVTKLGRYLLRNYDGDLKQDAPEMLCHVFKTHDVKTLTGELSDPMNSELSYLRYHGGDSLLFTDGRGDQYIVVQGASGSSALKSFATFKRGGQKVHVVDAGQLMAVHTVIDAVDDHVLDDHPKEQLEYREHIVAGLLDREKSPYALVNQSYDDHMIHDLAQNIGCDSDDPRIVLQAYDKAIAEEKDPMQRKGPSLRFSRTSCIHAGLRVNDAILDELSSSLNDERNNELNRQYKRRADTRNAATVYEDKKNLDPKHVQAGLSSSFARDFGHIEVDDSVDLAKFTSISKEYATYRQQLPKQRVPADFRFRMTGRHHANGVYTPSNKNIAVDPRSPSSFTHEYMHHIDFTTDANGHQLSMRPEFKKIVNDYQQRFDTTKVSNSELKHYIAPTEIFARAGELWMNWKANGEPSSLRHTPAEYSSKFDYRPLLDHKDEIMRLFDRL
jgi:hypothetical protein